MAHLQQRNGSTRFQVHSASSYPHRNYYLPSYPAPAYPTPPHPPSEPCYPISIPSPPLQFSSRPYKNDLPRSPSLTPDFAPNDITDDLCALTDQSDSPRTTSSPPCSVKVEPEEPDGCFIMEHPSFGGAFVMHKCAPPTEVPLRATHASSAMFKMMSVFRLNPFAMHSGKGRGVVSPTWHGGEARPLDEEPIEFVFQVDLEDLDGITSPLPNIKEKVRFFSPEFQLHRDELKNQDRTDWTEYPSEDISATSVDWEELECPAEDHLQPANLTGSYLRHHTRLHNSVSHPYLRKSQHHDQNQTSHTQYTNFPVSASNACLDLHRMPPSIIDGRTRSGLWGGCFGGAERAGYAPRRNNFADPSSSDSPVAEAVDLPSVLAQDHIHPSAISMNVSRRWSLPENRAPPNGPFLM